MLVFHLNLVRLIRQGFQVIQCHLKHIEVMNHTRWYHRLKRRRLILYRLGLRQFFYKFDPAD